MPLGALPLARLLLFLLLTLLLHLLALLVLLLALLLFLLLTLLLHLLALLVLLLALTLLLVLTLALHLFALLVLLLTLLLFGLLTLALHLFALLVLLLALLLFALLLLLALQDFLALADVVVLLFALLVLALLCVAAVLLAALLYLFTLLVLLLLATLILFALAAVFALLVLLLVAFAALFLLVALYGVTALLGVLLLFGRECVVAAFFTLLTLAVVEIGGFALFAFGAFLRRLFGFALAGALVLLFAAVHLVITRPLGIPFAHGGVARRRYRRTHAGVLSIGVRVMIFFRSGYPGRPVITITAYGWSVYIYASVAHYGVARTCTVVYCMHYDAATARAFDVVPCRACEVNPAAVVVRGVDDGGTVNDGYIITVVYIMVVYFGTIYVALRYEHPVRVGYIITDGYVYRNAWCQWRPAVVIATRSPGNPCRCPFRTGYPYPAVEVVVQPTAVVKGSPSPGVVRHPGVTVVGHDPIAIG